MAHHETVVTSSDTPKFRDLRPRDAGDQPCIDELRAVLARHGRLDRFGVCLLHEHFPIAADEVLKEYVDEVTRTATLTPVKMASLGGKNRFVATMWDLGNDKALIKCMYGHCD